jgi:hypothetical protein
MYNTLKVHKKPGKGKGTKGFFKKETLKKETPLR